jgi:hypothetical protein
MGTIAQTPVPVRPAFGETSAAMVALMGVS